MSDTSLINVADEIVNSTVFVKPFIKKKIRIICGILWIVHFCLGIASFTIGSRYAKGDCRENTDEPELHIDVILRVYGIYIFTATHILMLEFIMSHYIKTRNCLIMLTSICFTVFICATEIGFTMVILSVIFGDPYRCDDESKPLYDMGLSIVIINIAKYLPIPCLGCPCFRKKIML